jgi:hypothetical protein
MPMRGDAADLSRPRTNALRRALREVQDEAAAADLLFLEYWQTQRCPDIAASLRASQIRVVYEALKL